MNRSCSTGLQLLAAALTLSSAIQAQTLSATQITSGLSAPLYLCSPPGDTTRLFIVEQNGVIKIIKSGVTLPTPFIDLSSISACCGERGLLGLAFHPNYAANGKFYVSYTDNGGSSRVRQYNVSAGDPDVASTSGFVDIYGPVTQPFSNHNGGCIAFSPADGKLYLGLGDGGSGGDPGNRAQNLTTSLGKMLRFDVDIPAPFIPMDNPFVGAGGGVLPEIWAYGLRNPWRFSFDRASGDMYIADVGQNSFEEVDFQPFTSAGGENYGWRCMEGASCTGSSGCTCFAATLEMPIHTYVNGSNCSITGGYAYRGSNIPCFQGTYFFGDYCSGRIWTFRYDGMAVTGLVERTAELAIPGSELITSFGEDANGEIYVVDSSGGEIWRIDPGPGSSALCGDCARPTDGAITILDSFAAAQITVGLLATAGDQGCVCDTNADGDINVLDALVIAQDSVGLPVTLLCP